MNEALEKRFYEIEVLATRMGLDPFPVLFEEVPREVIWDVASYGLPTRMSHWSFGRSYVHQKTYGEMGFGKIYELVINNNPSYAFLDDTNSDVINMLIAAHVYGHSDFFKHNACFAKTNRSMVMQAAQNAAIIDQYKDKYGMEEVEEWMDIGFSLDRHIDPVLGEERRKYPDPEYEYKETRPPPYAELFGDDTKPQVTRRIKNDKFPPFKERDLLWFLHAYGNMEPWQREVLRIVRSESFYFYPQHLTKIANEGWASFWHAELMLNYEGLSGDEHLEFAKAHAGVVSPGGGANFNPYYVGFRIWTDIKKRWDEYHEAGKKDAAFQACPAMDFYDVDGKVTMSKMTGHEKMLKVRREDDDVAFVYNYLTKDLAEDMKLFTYGYRGASEDPDEDDVILKDRATSLVASAITAKLHNYGAPLIWVDKIGDAGTLVLSHSEVETPLDNDYAIETLKYIQRAWKKPVELNTHDRFKKDLRYTCDGDNVSKEVDGDKSVRMRI
jgi:stage V sporulation protein R